MLMPTQVLSGTTVALDCPSCAVHLIHLLRLVVRGRDMWLNEELRLIHSVCD